MTKEYNKGSVAETLNNMIEKTTKHQSDKGLTSDELQHYRSQYTDTLTAIALGLGKKKNEFTIGLPDQQANHTYRSFHHAVVGILSSLLKNNQNTLNHVQQKDMMFAHDPSHRAWSESIKTGLIAGGIATGITFAAVSMPLGYVLSLGHALGPSALIGGLGGSFPAMLAGIVIGLTAYAIAACVLKSKYNKEATERPNKLTSLFEAAAETTTTEPIAAHQQ